MTIKYDEAKKKNIFPFIDITGAYTGGTKIETKISKNQGLKYLTGTLSLKIDSDKIYDENGAITSLTDIVTKTFNLVKQYVPNVHLQCFSEKYENLFFANILQYDRSTTGNLKISVYFKIKKGFEVKKMLTLPQYFTFLQSIGAGSLGNFRLVPTTQSYTTKEGESRVGLKFYVKVISLYTILEPSESNEVFTLDFNSNATQLLDLEASI